MQKWKIDCLYGFYAVVEERDGYLFATTVKGFLPYHNTKVYRHVGPDRVQVKSISELEKGVQVVFVDDPDLAVPIFTVDSIYKLDVVRDKAVNF